MTRTVLRNALLLTLLTQHAFGDCDHLAGGVSIEIAGLSVQSTGWIEYDWTCIYPTHGTFSGSHKINDGAEGTIENVAISGSEHDPYNATISSGRYTNIVIRGR